MDSKKLLGVTGFQWDQGNLEKNWLKHGVSPLECEQVFFNQPLVVAPDLKHSQDEERFFALGRTDTDRYLFVVFTVRRRKLRVISARDMSRKERIIYGA
jgi:uncharacterized DUF497 family protein